MKNRTRRRAWAVRMMGMILLAAPPAFSAATAPDRAAMVDGNTRLACDLYRRLRLGNEGRNLFFSPFSISTALAMTYAGAAGETERQMAAALHFTLPRQQLHPAFAALLDDLRSSEEYELAIANRLWGQKGYPFRKEFLAGIEARIDDRNSDDVATVRRILTHLDSQREALSRVSVGLKLQLEASLTQAEQLLSSLEEEYEATRLIADQLVAGGLLDDVLGPLSGLGAEQAEPERRRLDPAEMAERYAETPGVQAVSVLSPAGEPLAGAPLAELRAQALASLRQAASAMLVPGQEDGVLVVTRHPAQRVTPARQVRADRRDVQCGRERSGSHRIPS